MAYRIILTSSILSHPLNRHIPAGIAEAARNLGPSCEITIMPPRTLMEPGALEGADMLIFLGSLSDARVPIEQMPEVAWQAGAVSVFWGTEDPYERDFAWRADEFDHVLSNDATNVKMTLERPKMRHLPLGASFANDFRPLRPLVSRDIGLFFCGAPYQNRRIFMQDLHDAGRRSLSALPLHLVGAQWSDHGFLAAAPELSHDRLQSLYTGAQIVLYLHRSLNIANDYLKLVSTTPGPRLFEAALAGSVQVCEFVSFEIERYFDPASEIRVVHSGVEAREVAEALVRDSETWHALAYAAQRRAITDHCYEQRLLQLLRMVAPANLASGAIEAMEVEEETLTAARLGRVVS